jgi:glycine/betaine/sarcosine/D-proline reductase family selenoprotein B
MTQELEKAGIPTALISALPEIPLAMGVPRVIRGVTITHLLGDPRLSTAEERRLRTAIVRAAIRSLETAPERPTVFTLD